MIDFISHPWPWYVAGALIGLVVPFVYWYGGRKWGVSSTLQDLCAAIAPADVPLFRYDWRREGGWRLTMAAGVLVGGAIAATLLAGDPSIAISAATQQDLHALGLTDLTGMMPREVFSWAALLQPAGFVLIVVGGFLIGFGARWAGGCTSGHAISGLSLLQKASLAAVVGFFVGGLITTHLLLGMIL